jgi:hypothetical protein
MNMAAPYMTLRPTAPTAMPAVVAFCDDDCPSLPPLSKASLFLGLPGVSSPAAFEFSSSMWPKMSILGLICIVRLRTIEASLL